MPPFPPTIRCMVVEVDMNLAAAKGMEIDQLADFRRQLRKEGTLLLRVCLLVVFGIEGLVIWRENGELVGVGIESIGLTGGGVDPRGFEKGAR